MLVLACGQKVLNRVSCPTNLNPSLMHRMRLVLVSICTLLFLEIQAQQSAGEELDLAQAVSVPAPPQPVPVTPIGIAKSPSVPTQLDSDDSLAGTSATLAPSPSQESQNQFHVSLSARSHFTPVNPRLNDTVTYQIEVNWKDSRIPVFVMAPDSVQFTGLKCVDQSTRHEKNASQGEVQNLTVFSYTLLPTQIGLAKAAALKVRYTTGISGAEEAVFAPAGHVEVLPPRFGFLGSLWFRAVAGLFVLLLLGWALWLGIRHWTQNRSGKVKRTDEGQNQRSTLVKDVLSLKSRIGHGESRPILNEMERLSLLHLRVVLKLADEAAKFDSLLDQWLGQHPDELEKQADWERLRDLFRLARYAGGHKEPHELQDAWRSLKRCLDVNDEL
jgi:hypothetical protein